jgi:hypothetical protein
VSDPLAVTDVEEVRVPGSDHLAVVSIGWAAPG